MKSLYSFIFIFIIIVFLLKFNECNNKCDNLLVVWIDGKVHNNENKQYQKEINNTNYVKLSCFPDVKEGIDYLITIRFCKTIIIVSGRKYPEFIKMFKNNINNLKIVPMTIIFTRNAPTFIDKYKNNPELMINHEFYNKGGVVDLFGPVYNFIQKEANLNIKYNKPKPINDERLIFEYIKEKNQLILPLYFSQYLKSPEDTDIQDFNNYMLTEYKYDNALKFIFTETAKTNKIPREIVSKFWARAYTFESNFYTKMNEDLQKTNFKTYLPFIQMMYEGIKIHSFEPEVSLPLYRGTRISKNEIIKIKNYLENKIDGLPGAIVYSRSFLSFSMDKKIALQFLNKKKLNKNKNEKIVLMNTIVDKNKNSLYTGNLKIKEVSYYPNEQEVLFFPFTCFQILNIKETYDEEYTIELNYLGEYKKLFEGENLEDLILKVPKTTMSETVILGGFIDDKYKLPEWAENLIIGGGTAAGSALGAYIGSFFSPILGPFVGGYIGGMLGKYYTNKTINKAYDYLNNL